MFQFHTEVIVEKKSLSFSPACSNSECGFGRLGEHNNNGVSHLTVSNVDLVKKLENCHCFPKLVTCTSSRRFYQTLPNLGLILGLRTSLSLAL